MDDPASILHARSGSALRLFAADNGAWWDVGVAEVSNLPRVNQATEQHLQARRSLQRFYGQAADAV